jgi:hypothetical protein
MSVQIKTEAYEVRELRKQPGVFVVVCEDGEVQSEGMTFEQAQALCYSWLEEDALDYDLEQELDLPGDSNA